MRTIKLTSMLVGLIFVISLLVAEINMVKTSKNLRDNSSNHAAATATRVVVPPPMPPGAVARVATTNKAVVLPPPVPTTNSLTLGWYSGIGFSNRLAYLQSSTSAWTGYSNVVPFTMGGSNVVVTVKFTNNARFFRLAWNSADLAQ